MIARELMTTDVISILPDAPVLEAVQAMLHHKVSGLPVVDEAGDLVGMITASDLLRRTEIATEFERGGFAESQAGSERLAADYVRAHGKRVRQVMTQHLHVVAEDSPVRKIADIMERHDIKRVPVMRGRKLVGLVSRTDLLRAFATAVEHQPTEPCDDDEIKRRLLAIYNHESWAPLANIDVSVHDGRVDIVGTVANEAQRSALMAAAESIPGVRAVIDHLVRTECFAARAWI